MSHFKILENIGQDGAGASQSFISLRQLSLMRLATLFVLVSTVFVSSLLAQREETLYFDKDWKGVRNRSKAEYFRIVALDSEEKPIGKVKDYYITGELQAEGWAIHIDKDDDRKTLWKGEVVSYYKTGQKSSVTTFNDEGLEHGLSTTWYEDGTKKTEAQYEKGVLHGFQNGWYEDGTKEAEGQYEEGNPHGLGTEWYENGNKKNEGQFQEGKLHGLRKSWYENGTKKGEGQYQEGKLHGLVIRWYEDGTKKEEVYYKEGNFHGLATTWYQNGTKKEERHYEEGNRHGLVTEWYEDGTKKAEAQYEEGVFHGFQNSWYEDGTKHIESQVRLGKLHGTGLIYYSGGTIKSKTVYKDGEADKWVIQCDEFTRCDKVFIDEFQTNVSGWPVGESENFLKKFTNEGLLLENKIDGAVGEWIHLPVDVEQNFSIEANLKSEVGKKAWYGLAFGFKDSENFLFFVIHTNGYYKTGRFVQGLQLGSHEWIPSEHIHKGRSHNLVKVNRVGDKLVFSLNGHLLDSTEDFFGFRGNYLGIYLGEKQKLLAKRIKVAVSEPYPAGIDGLPDEVSSVEWKSFGSGFVISRNGVIATNYHVVEGASEIGVHLVRNGIRQSYTAEVRTVDKQNDLALIQIVDSEYQPFDSLRYRFDTRLAEVGTSVFTLGYPEALTGMGEEVKFTDGKISSRTGFQGGVTEYQVSVPVQAGSSGGPLFDSDGNLVAIVNAVVVSAENVTYAIKSNYLKSLVDVLKPPIQLPHDESLSELPLTDQIKVLSEYVALILVR